MNMSKHFPNIHRVIIEHSWSGKLLRQPVVKYIKARDFDEWCDWMNEEGYDVCDNGTHEALIHSPYTTEVWCYPQWKLTKQED